MARNGSGVYSPPAADYPAVASTLIESTKFNNIITDIGTALTGSIAADGQTTVTADIPMNNKKITGLANATARTGVPALGQVQDGTLNWVDGGGTADAITATYSPAITALVDGQICCVRATAANATTTPTFAPNGLTARTIVMQGNSALVAGSIKADGHELILRYDLTNTRWELLNPAIPAAGVFTTISASGLITATGGQIAFPATRVPSADANTLDDYEEGTWTPVLTFDVPGNLSVAFLYNSAWYTKIGRLVTLSMHSRTSTFTHTTASGNMSITGLPFSPALDNSATGVLSWSGITKANYTQICTIVTSAPSLLLMASGSGQTSTGVSTSDAPTGSTIIFDCTITYHTS